MIKKILFILIIVLYQNNLYSKTNENKFFNQRYLYNYFSALLSFSNQDNKKTIKFFESNKKIINKSENLIKKYILSLSVEGKIEKAIKYIERNEGNNKFEFLEANLLLYSRAIVEKDFLKAKNHISKIKKFEDEGTFEMIISKAIQSYNHLFLNSEIKQNDYNLGKLGLVNRAFQECYIGSGKEQNFFLNLINSEDGDYSRYIFFYLNILINKEDIVTAKSLASTINELESNLLILQSKRWIEREEYKNFSQYFSCKSEADLISEFFFIIANLYSSQEQYEKSNFYLSISNYLNKKFIFNNSLVAENFFLIEEYDKAKYILNKFDKKFDIYFWYKIKKIGQIISFNKNNTEPINFIEDNFIKIKDPSFKIIYDYANIQKNFGNYKKSIEFYNRVINFVKNDNTSLSEIFYRRGSSYERIGDYKNSDKDLLKSLELVPNDPYVLNYLAYSWLERNIKINIAINMLEKAYDKTENDPYITDSLGWAYFLNKEYLKAEKYLNLAIQIKPDDPVIMDHYGDSLWMIGRKLQASYFWKRVLTSKNLEDIDVEKLKSKIIVGINNT